MLRFIFLGLVVIVSTQLALAGCWDKKFPNCTELAEFFGPESMCYETDCVEVCPTNARLQITALKRQIYTSPERHSVERYAAPVSSRN